ncbi:MAG: NDP-sugar synthase [Chloroflexi bacterium]|nr:NDP-sugar synthase [Chloroflexota bacterium]
MKAVILVGGQGTRLRPLTNNTPKPLIPLVNRPFLDHVLFLLRTHGIRDVILAMSYLSENFEQAYGDGSHLDMNLTYVHEVEPLGTGGAIKNVESALTPGESFLVFNGDILTDLDLEDMARYHRENNSICTISLTSVEDPSAYGVVDMDQTGRIERFTEKPRREEATSNWVNAGTYILEPQALDYIPQGQHYMVEFSLFPTLLAEGKPLYGYRTGAYWLDIGTPAKYLQAQTEILSGRLKYHLPPDGERMGELVWAGEGTFVDSGARITGPAVLGKHCQIEAGASITGPVVLGDGCRVEKEAHLEHMVAWNNVVFGPGSHSHECIVGSNASIGDGCEVSGTSIIGDNAVVGACAVITGGAKIEPGSVIL